MFKTVLFKIWYKYIGHGFVQIASDQKTENLMQFSLVQLFFLKFNHMFLKRIIPSSETQNKLTSYPWDILNKISNNTESNKIEHNNEDNNNLEHENNNSSDQQVTKKTVLEKVDQLNSTLPPVPAKTRADSPDQLKKVQKTQFVKM